MAPACQRALEGAYGAFFVTNFWEHLSGENELAQAHTLAAAAAQAGIRHAIWSTLEDTRDFFPADGSRMPVLEKRFNVPHFDAKGEAHRFFAQQRVPVTYLYTSGYWENLIHFGMGPQRQADGTLAVTFPTGDARIPWIGAEDIGVAAHRDLPARRSADLRLHRPRRRSPERRASWPCSWSAALGEHVVYNAVTPDAFPRARFPGRR